MNAIARMAIRIAKKSAFRFKKYTPEILMATGIACGVGATVLACKETLDAKNIVDEAKNDICEIHAKNEDPTVSYDEYSTEQYKSDLAKAYFLTAGKLIKNYAPALALGTVSIGCLVGSNAVIRNRLTGAVAAYAALDRSFKEYRSRVAGNVGVEKELESYHGVTKKLDTEQTENGLMVTDDSKVTVDGYSMYARCFDEYNPNWKNDPEYNLMFLRGCQRYLQACLERDGFLFLNDVYKELGFPPSQAGQLVGWIYDPDSVNHTGDNTVSFGLYNPSGKSPALGDFINGNSNSVFLDFNVDGVIIDRI